MSVFVSYVDRSFIIIYISCTLLSILINKFNLCPNLAHSLPMFSFHLIFDCIILASLAICQKWPINWSSLLICFQSMLLTSSITYMAAFSLRLSPDMPCFSNSWNVCFLTLVHFDAVEKRENLTDHKVVLLCEVSVTRQFESCLHFDKIQLEEVGKDK